jgi:rhamnosyltransferase
MEFNSEHIAAVTIFYNPHEKVLDNIRSYMDAVTRIYLVDNSTSPTGFLHSLASDKIKYLHDGNNAGIAQRLNQAASLARQEGFDFLLTMDEDSSFQKQMLHRYLDCFRNSESMNSTAMFGIESDHRLVSFSKDCIESGNEMLITSGSIVNLSLLEKLGGFDESLFIDYVDTEYCLRVMKAGYGVRKFKNISLNHSIGMASVHYSLKSFKKTSRSLHTPVRLYYMMRNYFYLRKKFKGKFEKEFVAIKKNLLVMIKNNLLYNTERTKVISYLVKAISDQRGGRMGKIVE